MSDREKAQAAHLLEQIAARLGDERTVAILARLSSLAGDPAARSLVLTRKANGRVDARYTDAL